MNQNFKELLKNVKGFIFDVDGVFSDNIILHPSGDMMRTMNIKDGFAVNYAVKKGFPIAIITGGNTESVRSRFANLGITDIFMKSFNKIHDYNTFIEKYNLKPCEILYMGDDIPDYPVMSKVGVPVCPADAVEEIKKVSVYISHKNGGQGCVRDVIEQTMRVQEIWVDPENFVW